MAVCVPLRIHGMALVNGKASNNEQLFVWYN